MEKLKLGMVGLGDHALQSHLAFMLHKDNTEIVGAFDPNPESFKRVADEYDVNLKSFGTYEELLDEVDAVIICSPDKFHLSQLEQAVAKGIHALCEKPLCCDESELERLKKVLDNKSVVITTCHPRRFDYPYAFAKSVIKKFNNIGKLVGVELDFSYHKPSADKANLHGGSMLQDHANHEIDYLNFLCGLESFTAYKLCDMIDRYEIAGMRVDGISFHFKGTRRLDSRRFDETISLRFEKADVVIYTKDSTQSFIYFHESHERMQLTHLETDYNYRFSEINANFCHAILAGSKNYVSSDDMLLNSQMSVSFKNRNVFEFKK